MNNGSLLSLNVSTRCGFSPNARQIRPTVDFDSPVSAAIEARDQWVASRGVLSKVSTTTCSTSSSVTERGPPGRGSSINPSNRFSTNRPRHLPTVAVEQPNRAATAWLSKPSAEHKMILDRNTNDFAHFARRDNSWARSSSVKVRSAFGRPVRGMPHSTTYPTNSWRNTLVGTDENRTRMTSRSPGRPG